MTPYYADEFVTLYHGDCREVTEWLTADVLVTDPPYGIGWEQEFGMKQRNRAQTVKNKDAVEGDRSPDVRDAALGMWGPRPAIVFGSWRVPRPTEARNLLIWHKAGAFAGVRSGHAFISNHEEIYLLGGGWISTGKPLYSVITTTEPRHVAVQQIGHPTPKPTGLMEQLIARCPLGLIADPFVGSGSTLIAAKSLGRTAVGVEIEERYCELAAKRLSQDVLDFGGVA
jgi:hypothetical protein